MGGAENIDTEEIDKRYKSGHWLFLCLFFVEPGVKRLPASTGDVGGF